ncbi:MAG: amidohydrolase family protein [Phycisphaerales bacterium]
MFASASSSIGADEADPKAATDKPAWNVDDPQGLTTAIEVPIDVDEGTWMNLDVSPDGTTIVFDLLGDLYTMPIGGGDAQSITSGLAWDMQPRFSPDGKRIAFTSDRAPSNGDNVWTINVDGSDSRQITKESFRLLSSPEWTPDGTSIVARKHFTSRRSLGAGEMWLYHAAGTEGAQGGLQLTTRPTEQKDVNEPAFSPDGKYLYYSLDATPGESFEYNKDSNTEIYCVDRLELSSGKTERFISGPGGAVRPTPAPDGKSVAFVRRMRERTALFIMDVPSQRVRPIYDQLERDMQESWAIHGVYPGFSWTPDSKSIVFYAKGKIRKIAADASFEPGSDAAATVIPFRVKTTRTVREALRFPIEVAPEQFDVKVLRWVEVSPKGDRAVFQALGRLYVRDLGAGGVVGAQRRLTRAEDRLEYFPCWSRDGSKLAFTTWDDEKLAEVRVLDVASGTETVVTTEPGHYVHPVFSPDGTKVVFGKVSGGFITDPAWSDEPGVYWAPSTGGGEKGAVAPVKITDKGTQPQFGADGDRVYLMTVTSEKERDRRSLISMKLDGTEERTHFTSENATQYAVSHDGKWCAFTERFNVFITPMVDTGRSVDIGPKASGFPVAKVSKDAGENLHWSGDSAKLHWSLGPTLYTRALKDSFAFLEGAPEKPLDPEGSGVALGWKEPLASPTGTIALTNARVLTMNGDEVIEDANVIIKGNRIQAVVPFAKMTTNIQPLADIVIDCKGKTIMPGFVDVHAHGPQGTQHGVVPKRNWGRYADVAFGVTTVHDPSNDTNTIFAASEMQKAGLIVAPRTFSTGTILYGAAGSFKAEVESLDDARFHLRRMQAVGAFTVKSYNQPRRDQRQQVLAAAKELGMMVVPEGGSTHTHNFTMVADGHTGVEHTLPLARIYKDVIQFWGPSKVGYTPTIGVGYGGLTGETYWYDTTDVWRDARLANFVPRWVIEPRAVRRPRAPREDYNHFELTTICKALTDVGIGVNIGAHGQLAGLAAHWEIWMLEQGGMTEFECLRAATINGARYIGLDQDLGTVEAGKLADLIILDKDPSQNIRDTASIKWVMLNGRLYDSMTMDQVQPTPTKRPRWFFDGMNAGRGIQTWTMQCAGCGHCGAGCVDKAWDESGYR